MTRVAVVDLGSNSTRLLIADVDGETLTEVERHSVVTRLAEGVEASGRLGDDAVDRVRSVLTRYAERIAATGCRRAVGVLTSAVRDAADGAAFAEEVRSRFGIDARTIPGEEEARLTYLGATGDLPAGPRTAVVDIGGGSTEFVVGVGERLRFRRSTQVGVVRHGERHLLADPPAPAQLQALRDDVAQTFAAEIPAGLDPARALAVAGTATQCATMLGTHTLTRDRLAGLLERLAALPLEQRRSVAGLDPDRAPTIVAGVAILLEALAALDLDAARATDHDILRGVARAAARRTRIPKSPS